MVLNADNIRQNIRNQVKKSSKIEQDQKVLISASAKFLTNFNNSCFFFDDWLGTRFYHDLILRFFYF